MLILKKMLLLAVICSTALVGFAQQEVTEEELMEQETVKPDTTKGEKKVLQDTIPETDGYYQSMDRKDVIPFAQPKVNLNTIRFYKRIWRDIDLTDTANYILAMPGNTLMQAIMEGIQMGKLTAYDPADDAFKTKMSARDGEARFADSVLVPIFDDEGNQIDAQMALNEFNPEAITKFRVKEDIFWNRQRSTIETRIVGVAPLMDISTSAELAESVGSTPAFWLYYPQLRFILVQRDLSDPDMGLYDVTMDDIFMQHRFASTIIRESSPRAQEGNLSLAEAEQVEKKIKEFKENTWTVPKGVDKDKLYQPSAQFQKKKAQPAKKAASEMKEEEEINTSVTANSGNENQ